jgi:Right handed beta helix region
MPTMEVGHDQFIESSEESLKIVRLLAVLVLVAAGVGACQARTTPPPPDPAVRTPAVDATGATDVAAPMAAFLAAVPDGSVVTLQRDGVYRMESTLTIANRRNLTIRGNGATFVITTPGDRSTVEAARRTRARPSVRVIKSTGITIHDLHVVGANPDAGHADAGYKAEYEAQHGFDILDSSRISVIGCSVRDVYGDFIYLGGGAGPSSRASEVLIQNFVGLRSGRQGIGIGSASNVIIENSTLTEARRATIDFEPEQPGTVDNVIIRNNRVVGGRLTFVGAGGHGPVDHITIQNNRLTNHVLDIDVRDLDGGRRSDWKVLNNVGDRDPIDRNWAGNPNGATMLFARVDGLVVRGNTQIMRLGEVAGGLAPFMYGVRATDSTGVDVSGNNFPQSAGQVKFVTTTG